jgi:hypothetical protein
MRIAKLLLLLPVLAACASQVPTVVTAASPSCTRTSSGWISVFAGGHPFQPPVQGSAKVCQSGLTITDGGGGVRTYESPILIITYSGKQEIIPLVNDVKYAVTNNKPLS